MWLAAGLGPGLRLLLRENDEDACRPLLGQSRTFVDVHRVLLDETRDVKVLVDLGPVDAFTLRYDLEDRALTVRRVAQALERCVRNTNARPIPELDDHEAVLKKNRLRTVSAPTATAAGTRHCTSS